MKVSDPFDLGAGHINPVRAMDPGLVYDMKTEDYVLFLCNIGYTQDQIKSMLLHCNHTNTRCPAGGGYENSNANLNYPSITISNLQCATTIKRTVRNVGHNKIAVYFVSIMSPNGVQVVVWPSVLIFSPFKEEASFYVTFTPMKISRGRFDFGEIVWSDGFHQVRSPLVVLVNTTHSITHATT